MTGHCQLNLVTSLHPMLILFLFVDVKSNYSLPVGCQLEHLM